MDELVFSLGVVVIARGEVMKKSLLVARVFFEPFASHLAEAQIAVVDLTSQIRGTPANLLNQWEIALPLETLHVGENLGVGADSLRKPRNHTPPFVFAGTRK